MIKTIFRFLLALLAILVVSQAWGLVASPDDDTYWYDQTYIATTTQNHIYDTAPNLISTSKQQPSDSLLEYSEIKFTLAFVDDFVATKKAPFTKINIEKGLTRKSPTQINTNLSTEQAIKNLENNGFTKKAFKAQNGGTGHVLTNGKGKVYRFYPNAISGVGDSAKVITNGKTTSAIRLNQGL